MFHLEDAVKNRAMKIRPPSGRSPVTPPSPRVAHAIKNARSQEPAPPKTARRNLSLRQNETYRGNNGNGCNQKCGRENMHRDNPDATQIARDAKNACGVDDNMTTNVAAVGFCVKT